MKTLKHKVIKRVKRVDNVDFPVLIMILVFLMISVFYGCSM